MRHVSDGLLDLLRLSCQVKTSHAGAASSGREQPAQHADGGGLSSAIGAQETKNLPAVDGETHMVHSDEIAETLDQVFGFYGDRFAIHWRVPVETQKTY